MNIKNVMLTISILLMTISNIHAGGVIVKDDLDYHVYTIHSEDGDIVTYGVAKDRSDIKQQVPEIVSMYDDIEIDGETGSVSDKIFEANKLISLYRSSHQGEAPMFQFEIALKVIFKRIIYFWELL